MPSVELSFKIWKFMTKKCREINFLLVSEILIVSKALSLVQKYVYITTIMYKIMSKRTRQRHKNTNNNFCSCIVTKQ